MISKIYLRRINMTKLRTVEILRAGVWYNEGFEDIQNTRLYNKKIQERIENCKNYMMAVKAVNSVSNN